MKFFVNFLHTQVKRKLKKIVKSCKIEDVKCPQKAFLFICRWVFFAQLLGFLFIVALTFHEYVK